MWLAAVLLLSALIGPSSEATEPSSSVGFKYAAVWRGELNGEWTEAYPEEASKWSCVISLAFMIPEKGGGSNSAPLSGEARIRLQQPHFTHYNPNITSVSAMISPMEYIVWITGSITLDPPRLEIYPDAEPPIIATVTYHPKEGEPTTRRAQWMTGVLWLFERLEYMDISGEAMTLSLSTVYQSDSFTVSGEGEVSGAPLIDEAARVTSVVGRAKVTGYVGEEDLEEGSIVGYEELITVGEGSRVELMLLDGSKVVLDEGTRFSMGIHLLQEEEFTFNVLLGRIWSRIASDPQRRRESVFRTPSAVDAVRGTEFVVDVAEDGATTLIVLDGVVEISDLTYQKMVVVRQNETVVVEPGDLPSNPEQININQMDRWWEKVEAPESPPFPVIPNLMNYAPYLIAIIAVALIVMFWIKRRS
jgi:hypothetical protein